MLCCRRVFKTTLYATIHFLSMIELRKMYAIRCHDIDNLEVTIGSLALEHTLANRIIDQIFYFTVGLKIRMRIEL